MVRPVSAAAFLRDSKALSKTLLCSDRMKGNTMDAMSLAVDGAVCMLYGVSLAYKESANCRLEANCNDHNRYHDTFGCG